MFIKGLINKIFPALFVGFNVSDLAAICAFPLGSSSLRASSSGGIRSAG